MRSRYEVYPTSIYRHDTVRRVKQKILQVKIASTTTQLSPVHQGRPSLHMHSLLHRMQRSERHRGINLSPLNPPPATPPTIPIPVQRRCDINPTQSMRRNTIPPSAGVDCLAEIPSLTWRTTVAQPGLHVLDHCRDVGAAPLLADELGQDPLQSFQGSA